MTQHWGMLLQPSALSKSQSRQIYREQKAGRLLKLMPGVFIDAEYFHAQPQWEQYRLKCAAVGSSRRKCVLVGKSAAAIWGIPFGETPDYVDVAARDGAGGVGGRGIRRRQLAKLHGYAPVFHRGIWLSTVTQTVIDLARWYPLADAVAAADYCLNKSVFSLASLDSCRRKYSGYHGVSNLDNLMVLAHPAAESPRESAMRVAMWENKLPVPDIQAAIRSESGRFLGRVDLLFSDYSVICEYDGAGKYNGQFGSAPADVIRDELRRQKALLNAGNRIIRITSETFRDGSWLPDLQRELSQGIGRPLAPHLWTSSGLGWGTTSEKVTPRGALYT